MQLTGNKALNPPLGLLTVAALLPSAWELNLADLNTRSLTEQDWQGADLIIISAMYIQREGLLTLVREAKHRGKIVVVGGPFASSLPEVVLEAGCDFVVRGEAENTTPLLLEAMREGKTGIIENPEKPDLITSPIPRFDLLRLGDYQELMIQTSRGCPFNCEFCDVVSLFGRKMRHKTPLQVIAELETLYRLGAGGGVFICDDNFIGNKQYARAILQELTPWLKSRGGPFTFTTQVSADLGHDLELIDLMNANNLGRVIIGVESPDEKVLELSRKYHNIKNPLVESVNNLKKNGMTVVGSFIIGFDGEEKGAGERICSFIEETSIPMAMLGTLQAPPHTSLWNRLKREGRLRSDEAHDGGTFSLSNFEMDRPESEIMQEYVDAWDYLYEPSRYFARAYRYYLAVRPTRRASAIAEGATPPDDSPDPKMTWRRGFKELRTLLKILWRHGIRPPYRRQFWTQLTGMWKQNPSRLRIYLATCAMAEDLFDIREMVRKKFSVIMQDKPL